MKKLSKSSAAALLTLALGVVPVIPAIAAAPPGKADVKVTTKHSVAVDGEVMEDGILNVDGVIITFVEDENGVKRRLHKAGAPNRREEAADSIWICGFFPRFLKNTV